MRTPVRVARRLAPSLVAANPRVAGLFAYQGNNDTRAVEYPWAFYATPLSPGLRVLEIGGGLSGFQFVLDREGLDVTNVDPGEAASGLGWPCDQAHVDRLNRAFRTSVVLRNTTLDAAGIPDASVDRVFSISAIEHIPAEEHPLLGSEIRRVLKPGGYVVLTIDLFFDLAPFTDVEHNEWGRNIDVRQLVDHIGLEVVTGDPSELCGYPAFDPRRVLALLPNLYYGRGYPVCPQLLVLRAASS